MRNICRNQACVQEKVSRLEIQIRAKVNLADALAKLVEQMDIAIKTKGIEPRTRNIRHSEHHKWLPKTNIREVIWADEEEDEVGPTPQ